MYRIVQRKLATFFSIILISHLEVNGDVGNETPIIGILSQETYIISKIFNGKRPDSFIAASYVKYLESAGARVVPVWIGQDETYYQRVINYTNGLLFPGGGTYFNETGGYGEAANHLYNMAVDANKNQGVYYPIWGTCLGMQAMMYGALNGKRDIRTECSLRHVSIPLDFVDGYQNSKLFSKITTDLTEILQKQNVTYNLHRYCITEEVLKENGLAGEWKILTTNKDNSNVDFISTMEHVKFPFYGVQFHPEKNQFEFRKNTGFPHSRDAVRAAQYFANFFVDECRKNDNSFPDENLEDKSLIYNYCPIYSGLNNSYYEQIYVFENNDFKKTQLQ